MTRVTESLQTLDSAAIRGPVGKFQVATRGGNKPRVDVPVPDRWRRVRGEALRLRVPPRAGVGLEVPTPLDAFPVEVAVTTVNW